MNEEVFQSEVDPRGEEVIQSGAVFHGETVFQSEQARAIIRYVREHFGDELEFLWESSPRTAIWRNPRNRKWYALLTVVAKNKLGLDSDELVEIIDLRFAKNEALDFAESNENVYPGYHMNKRNWITVILDGSMELEQVLGLLEGSYGTVNEYY